MTIFQKCGPQADLGWPWLPLVTVTIFSLFQLYSRQFAMDEKNERFIKQLL
jgi:hypothetical protein